MTERGPHVVIKVGGSLFRHPAALEVVGDALDQWAAAAASTGDVATLVVVPGGGPFADAVRDLDREQHVGDDAAHWLAILAMTQYGQLLVSRWPRAALVEDPTAAGPVCASGRIPILAPYQMLRARDPLPHSWDVTSDSIAAWLAFDVGATMLILVKPAAGSTEEMTDRHFECLMSWAAEERHALTLRICTADELNAGWHSMAQMPATRCCCRAG